MATSMSDTGRCFLPHFSQLFIYLFKKFTIYFSQSGQSDLAVWKNSASHECLSERWAQQGGAVSTDEGQMMMVVVVDVSHGFRKLLEIVK